MAERQYRDTDIEAILGRASLIQHEQAAPSGLEPDTARATVLEIGRTIGLQTGALERAFQEDHLAHLDSQQWLAQIQYAPTLRAIAEPILNQGAAWAHEQGWSFRATYRPIRVDRPGEVSDGRGAPEPRAASRTQVVTGLRATLHHVIRRGVYFLGLPVVNPSVRPLMTLDLHTFHGAWYLQGRICDHELVPILDAALLFAREQVGGRLVVDVIEIGQ